MDLLILLPPPFFWFCHEVSNVQVGIFDNLTCSSRRNLWCKKSDMFGGLVDYATRKFACCFPFYLYSALRIPYSVFCTLFFLYSVLIGPRLRCLKPLAFTLWDSKTIFVKLLALDELAVFNHTGFIPNGGLSVVPQDCPHPSTQSPPLSAPP